MNRFRFVGKIGLNALDSKIPYKREGVTTNGDKYVTFNCIVNQDKNNRAFCELYGQVREKIETKDVNGDSIVIPWDQRNDEGWLKKVAYYRQYSIKFNDEKHSFITDYDFSKFLCSNASLLKDKDFIVMGTIKLNVYNGKVSQRFVIQNMYEVENEEKPNLEVDFDYVWTAASIDTEEWAEKKIVNINGYFSQYINSTLQNKYVSCPVIFDASKIDFNDEKHLTVLNMKLKQIGLEYVNGTIKSKIKKESVCQLPIRCRYTNGAETVEFDESQLSENQKSLIACGLMTLDDFRPKGTIYGERVTTYKLFSFNLRDDYADGFIVLKDITPDDFKDMIYSPDAEPAAPKKETAKPADVSSDNGVDLDDLFN